MFSLQTAFELKLKYQPFPGLQPISLPYRFQNHQPLQSCESVPLNISLLFIVSLKIPNMYPYSRRSFFHFLIYFWPLWLSQTSTLHSVKILLPPRHGSGADICMTVDECISPLLNMVSVYHSRYSLYIWASLVAQTVKRLPTMREMRVWPCEWMNPVWIMLYVLRKQTLRNTDQFHAFYFMVGETEVCKFRSVLKLSIGFAIISNYYSCFVNYFEKHIVS